MKNEYQNIKMWRTTLSNLRMIYALTGEKMVEILDRLVKTELKKIQAKRAKDDSSDVD